MSIDEIEAAALQLPGDQLHELIDRLAVHRGMDPETEQGWLEEVQRRVAEYDRGEVEGIPTEVTLAKMRAMQIPPADRAELADRLIASLTGNRTCDPAWEAEMNRRIAEVEAGTAKTLSEEEFFEKLKTRRDARQIS